MIALLTSVALAAAMPVLPARKANELVATAAGKNPRPVVLHFWATWCEACRDEFPALRPQLTGLPSQRRRGAAGQHRPAGGIARRQRRCWRTSASSGCTPSCSTHPDPAPVARAVGEPTWDGTLPATFVFDEKGKLRKSFIGRADPNKLKTAVRAVMK